MHHEHPWAWCTFCLFMYHMTVKVGRRVGYSALNGAFPLLQTGVGESKNGWVFIGAPPLLPVKRHTISLGYRCTFNHVSSILKSPVGLAVSMNKRGDKTHVCVHIFYENGCYLAKLLCLVLSWWLRCTCTCICKRIHIDCSNSHESWRKAL